MPDDNGGDPSSNGDDECSRIVLTFHGPRRDIRIAMEAATLGDVCEAAQWLTRMAQRNINGTLNAHTRDKRPRLFTPQ